MSNHQKNQLLTALIAVLLVAAGAVALAMFGSDEDNPVTAGKAGKAGNPPAEQSPETLTGDDGRRGESNDPQRSQLAGDRGFYSAVAGSRFGYRLKLASTTSFKLQMGEQAQATELRVDLRGRLRMTVVARRKLAPQGLEELLIEVRGIGCTVTMTAGGQVADRAAGQRLTNDLDAGALVHMQSDGTTLGYRFRPEVHPDNRNWIRTLVSGCRFVVQPGEKRWEKFESDGVGTARIGYRWTATGGTPGHTLNKLNKLKSEYLQPAQIAERVVLPKVTGRGSAQMSSELGWFQEVHYQETVGHKDDDAGMNVTSVIELACTGLETSRVARQDLPEASFAGDWSPVLGIQESQDLPDRKLAQQWQEELEGVRLKDLIAQILDLIRLGRMDTQEMFMLREKLSWMVRLTPETLKELAPMVTASDFGADGAMVVLAAVGAAQIPEAQEFLGGILGDARAIGSLRESAALALFQVSEPGDALMARLNGMLPGATDKSDIGTTSLLLYGTLVARHQGKAGAESMARLLQYEAVAKENGREGDWLAAVGNAGGPKALEVAQRYMDHKSADVRATAIDALRDVRSLEATDTIAAAAMGDPVGQVRARAVALLAVRNNEAAMEALTQVLDQDKSTLVRRTAIDHLGPQAKNRKDVRSLLEKVSRKDADPQLRKLAQEFLKR